MSAHGWCWRCAEDGRSRRGVDTGDGHDVLCDRCRGDLAEVLATVVLLPVLPPEWYERPAKVGRARRWRRL